MWQEPRVAEEWMQRAPKLFSHPHPRIRHSVIWNLRTASWQNPQLGATGLKFAQEGLKDSDLGLQRASIWAHGDFVVNDPNLFDKAYKSLDQFLEQNPRESNYLFSLERFFRSVRVPFGTDPRFRASVLRMMGNSGGSPGLRVRATTMIDEEMSDEKLRADIESVNQRYDRAVKGTYLSTFSRDQSFIATAHNFQESKTFRECLHHLSLMRYLAWLSGDLKEPFEILAQTLIDKRDGDLDRSASSVMADCTIRKPDELASTASNAVRNFFTQSDNEGSQIVIQLILDPVRHASQASQQEVEAVMPTLHKYVANRSVSFALGNY